MDVKGLAFNFDYRVSRTEQHEAHLYDNEKNAKNQFSSVDTVRLTGSIVRQSVSVHAEALNQSLKTAKHSPDLSLSLDAMHELSRDIIRYISSEFEQFKIQAANPQSYGSFFDEMTRKIEEGFGDALNMLKNPNQVVQANSEYGKKLILKGVEALHQMASSELNLTDTNTATVDSAVIEFQSLTRKHIQFSLVKNDPQPVDGDLSLSTQYRAQAIKGETSNELNQAVVYAEELTLRFDAYQISHEDAKPGDSATIQTSNANLNRGYGDLHENHHKAPHDLDIQAFRGALEKFTTTINEMSAEPMEFAEILIEAISGEYKIRRADELKAIVAESVQQTNK